MLRMRLGSVIILSSTCCDSLSLQRLDQRFKLSADDVAKDVGESSTFVQAGEYTQNLLVDIYLAHTTEYIYMYISWLFLLS